MFCVRVRRRKESSIMKKSNAFAVCMRAVGVARAFPVATWHAHATASAHAAAPAAQRKRRTAAAIAASVDGGIT
jgi:hypothetical protein